MIGDVGGLLLSGSLASKKGAGGAGFKGKKVGPYSVESPTIRSAKWAHGKGITRIEGKPVINGKVNGKIPLADYMKIRKQSVHNTNADTIVLGKYDAEGKSYVKEAKKGKSNYFDLGNKWDSIKKNII